MALELVNPEDLPTPESYTHVVVATGSRPLAAAGAGPEQVARITIYVVGHRPEYLPDISAARIAVFGDHKPADTIVGVETLAEPGRLIEVEAVAVVD
jgi:enamine deaminase RidA (YjgF/YER057c/UK114 family)